MLGGKSLANDTSHCGHSLAVDGCLLLKLTLCSLSHMANERGSECIFLSIIIHKIPPTQTLSDESFK